MLKAHHKEVTSLISKYIFGSLYENAFMYLSMTHICNELCFLLLKTIMYFQMNQLGDLRTCHS